MKIRYIMGNRLKFTKNFLEVILHPFESSDFYYVRGTVKHFKEEKSESEEEQLERDFGRRHYNF